jgi:hypothetical protein
VVKGELLKLATIFHFERQRHEQCVLSTILKNSSELAIEKLIQSSRNLKC